MRKALSFVAVTLGLIGAAVTAGAAQRSLAQIKVDEELARVKAEIGSKLNECNDKQCLIAQEAKCVPSHARITHGTVEGGSIAEDWFVRRSSSGSCSITLVVDMTADYYGGCRIMVRDCPTIAAASSDDSKSMGCKQRDIWHKPVCTR